MPEHRPARTWPRPASRRCPTAGSKVDCYGRTSVAGVWALGDVTSDFQLKHVANHEARVVAHNLAHPDELREFDHRFVPSAVFTDPQIASVGMTEDELRAAGLDYVAATQDYGDTAYGWAMEDTTGICKLIADPRHRAAARRAPDGLPGLQPDPAADPGDVASASGCPSSPAASTGSTRR